MLWQLTVPAGHSLTGCLQQPRRFSLPLDACWLVFTTNARQESVPDGCHACPQGVKDINFNEDGRKFLSSSFDKVPGNPLIRLWNCFMHEVAQCYGTAACKARCQLLAWILVGLCIQAIPPSDAVAIHLCYK